MELGVPAGEHIGVSSCLNKQFSTHTEGLRDFAASWSLWYRKGLHLGHSYPSIKSNDQATFHCLSHQYPQILQETGETE